MSCCYSYKPRGSPLPGYHTNSQFQRLKALDCVVSTAGSWGASGKLCFILFPGFCLLELFQCFLDFTGISSIPVFLSTYQCFLSDVSLLVVGLHSQWTQIHPIPTQRPCLQLLQKRCWQLVFQHMNLASHDSIHPKWMPREVEWLCKLISWCTVMRLDKTNSLNFFID